MSQFKLNVDFTALFIARYNTEYSVIKLDRYKISSTSKNPDPVKYKK
jgi:hypothetical protein